MAVVERASRLDETLVSERRFPLDPSLLCLTPEEFDFFKVQTGIDNEEALLEHIRQVAADAYELYPYPCIRWYTFTRLGISSHPAYQHVLALASSNASIFVDIGAGFGTDLRKLIADGFPADRAIAFDLRPDLWDVGHRLFMSTPKSFSAQFVQGNVFDLEPFLAEQQPLSQCDDSSGPPRRLSSLALLVGRISAIHAGYFFHLFSEAEQERIARILSGLLRREPGAVIFGRHKGLLSPGFDDAHTNKQGLFCHSPDSWKALWTSILGDHAEVTAELSCVPEGHLASAGGGGDGAGVPPARTPQGSRFITWSIRLI